MPEQHERLQFIEISTWREQHTLSDAREIQFAIWRKR